MERKKMLITGFFFTFIIGTLMHFTYHWTGCSAITGLLVPVNESMWEHLKMLAMPMLLFGLFEKRGYAKELKNFWPARLLSIVSGMVILVLFYDLWLVVAGDGGLTLDIIDFVVGVALAWVINGKLLASGRFASKTARTLAAVGIAALLAIFFVFTWQPPQVNFFRDPPTGTFGPVK